MFMDYPIIDCHCHVYPEKIAKQAVEGISNFYSMPMAYYGSCDELISSGNEIGVGHYIIFSVATTPHQVSSINGFIAKTVEENKDIMSGFGTLHPDSESIEADIEQIIALGLKGVKMHPDFQKFKIDDEKCDKIYSLCQGRLPILLHTGDSRYDFSNPDRMKSVLDRYPNLTVIGAHFGGWSCWDEAAEKLSGYDNFYVDCSSTFHWKSPEECVRLVRKFGADKVLFGVDFPMWSHKKEYEKFLMMNLNEDENRKILFENANRLFSLNVSGEI